MEVVVIRVQNLRNARRVMALDKPKESLTKIDFQLLLLWKLVEIAEEWERSLKNHVDRKKIQIEIPPGIEDGMTLQLQGRGISYENESPGDLFIRIHIKPHQIFERLENGDILYSLKLKFTELVLGTEIVIPTLYGGEKLKIPVGTQIDSILRLRGKGIPVHGRRSNGDQIVKLKLDIPTKLTERQKWLIKELDDTKNI